MAVDLQPRLRDLRVAGPVACAWVCAVVLVGAASSAGWVVLGGGVVLCGAVVGLVASPASARVALGLVAAAAALSALVAVAVVVGETRRSPAVLVDRVAHASSMDVEVVLGKDLAAGDRSVVGTLRRADGLAGLRVPVRVVPPFASGPGSGSGVTTGAERALPAGTRMTASASVEPDEAGSSTAFVLFLRGSAVTEAPSGLLAVTDRARRSFVTVTETLPEPGASLLRGLSIGDRSGLDPETEAAMETSALTHLTAVSGHIATNTG